MSQKTFQVPAIDCAGCVRTVKNELSQLAGVRHVDADLDTKVVTVEWDSPASWDQIEDKLVEIEYPPVQA